MKISKVIRYNLISINQGIKRWKTNKEHGFTEPFPSTNNNEETVKKAVWKPGAEHYKNDNW